MENKFCIESFLYRKKSKIGCPASVKVKVFSTSYIRRKENRNEQRNEQRKITSKA